MPENKVNELALFEDYRNKVILPSKKEIYQNSRSRSAKLRFAIRSRNNFKNPEELTKKFKRYIDLGGNKCLELNLLISSFIFATFLIITPALKNETRMIRKKISNLNKNILLKKKILMKLNLIFITLHHQLKSKKKLT